MNEPDLIVTEAIKNSIKQTLRITTTVFDDDVNEIILEGMADIQADVGPLSFSETTIVSLKAMSLLKVYCFYSWNNMKHDFKDDNQRDIISLQIQNAKNQRRPEIEKTEEFQ